MLLLVRHGETEGNISKERYLDLSDDEMVLTERGREDICRLRDEYVFGKQICAVICAPERRCRQTAELLVPAVSYSIDDRVRAQNWGPLDFVGARVLLASSNKWPSGMDVRFPGGESAREVRQRCAPFGEEIMTGELERPDALTLVVTHGVIIRSLLSTWLGWTEEETAATPSLRPGTGVMITLPLQMDYVPLAR